MERKSTVWTFQATIKGNITSEDLEIVKKRETLRETESILIAAKNNAIKTYHIKARIDKTLQNSKCRLCDDRDETMNHIISEFSTQKECKNWHDMVGKLIYWELCKKLKFDHTNKWYMHNPESVLENETHKLLSDFEIQTDHLISARRLDLVIEKTKRWKRKPQ